MIDHPSYCSFLVRLWREPGAKNDTWRGEVEHIQSGVVIEVFSLKEALSLIQHTVVGDEERPGASESESQRTPVSDRH